MSHNGDPTADGRMNLLSTWQSALFEVLIEEDENAALAVLRATHPAAARSIVRLIEADLSVEEALAYSRALVEMGRDQEAVDVFSCVLRDTVGCGGRSQAGQRAPGGHWFTGDVPQA